MAKKTIGPYDDYNDLQLLQRYFKLCEDFEEFITIPRWEGVEISHEQSQVAAIKIDKIVLECYLRGLMGPSTLPPEERAKVVKQA